MIKSKAFSTFIVCSILISGISNSFVLGMAVESTHPSRSIFNLKNATKAALVTLLAFISTADSEPPLVCPAVLALNGEHNCTHIHFNNPSYWPGVLMGEALKTCIPYCTDPHPDPKRNDFTAPKTFICEANSTDLAPLLEKMEEDNVPYYRSWVQDGIEGRTFDFYTYESNNTAHFKVPEQYFTVKEIEDNSEAMKIIKGSFDANNEIFDRPCHEFRLVPGQKPPKSESHKQNRKLRDKSKKQRRR